MRRRDFLRGAGRVGLASALAGMKPGCSDADAAVETTTGEVSEGLEQGSGTESPGTRLESVPPEPIEITKAPWVHLHGEGRALLRLESLHDRPVEVHVEVGEEVRVLTAQVSVELVDFNWPPNNLIQVDHPDVEGEYAVHEVLLENLPPDSLVRYEIVSEGVVLRGGAFRTPPPPGTETRVVWISDTMYPKTERTLEMVADAAGGLVLHGGDIQYQTNPLDTWAGLFHLFEPALSAAAIHFCIGNHEYERFNEFDLYYRRLFEGQGDEGRTLDYHAFTWAGIRFLMLNSEVDFDEPGEQLAWATRELQRADADPNIRYTVAAFHRPYFTFSRSGPRLRTREIWHALFLEHNVPLVLTGHNHCYERFLVDGITYIMDGGGGALTYSIEERVEEASEEELATRLSAERSHGITIMDIDADGQMRGHRLNEFGDVHDEWTVGPRENASD